MVATTGFEALAGDRRQHRGDRKLGVPQRWDEDGDHSVDTRVSQHRLECLREVLGPARTEQEERVVDHDMPGRSRSERRVTSDSDAISSPLPVHASAASRASGIELPTIAMRRPGDNGWLVRT